VSTITITSAQAAFQPAIGPRNHHNTFTHLAIANGAARYAALVIHRELSRGTASATRPARSCIPAIA